MSDSPITKIELVGHNVLFSEGDWRVAVPIYGYTHADETYQELAHQSDLAIYRVVDGNLTFDWGGEEPSETVCAALETERD